MKRYLFRFFLTPLLGVCGCMAFNFTQASIIQAEDNGQFGIYVVKESMSPEQFVHTDIKGVELEKSPILSLDDILTYRPANHAMTVTSSAYQRLEDMPVPLTGKPFVVCVGEERIYGGAFWTPLSSAIFPGIVINWPAAEKNVLVLQPGYPDAQCFQEMDSRSDPRILRALERAGKLLLDSNDPEPSMKGIELYSFLDQDGEIKYALLIGTNRLKTFEEVKRAAVSRHTLLTQLGKLARGEQIFWNISNDDDMKLQYPDPPIQEEITREADTFGLTIIFCQ